MSPKDDEGDVVPKRVLDWLTWAGGIATALATIFALFFPNLGEDAQRLAYGAAFLLLAASAAVFYYRRRRAARYKIAELLEPLASSAALRGLLPFEEGDLLPGRTRDVQESSAPTGC
ncbi:MAG: hypothetical protein ACRDH2_11190 [Anaerolineales bacterium]